MAAPRLQAAQRRRLREMRRSAGWPCHEGLELELLAMGLLQRQWDGQRRETLRVTDAGIKVLAATRCSNQAARSAHEALVAQVAREMQRNSRLVWRGLSLRSPLTAEDGNTRWVVAIPDVFSIRHTSVEEYVEPVAHEIKVSRADLLADLRHVEKGQAYRALASQCWYVVREGVAQPDEVPPAYGVMVAGADGLTVARVAHKRPMRLPFSVWMALAQGRGGVPARGCAIGAGRRALRGRLSQGLAQFGCARPVAAKEKGPPLAALSRWRNARLNQSSALTLRRLAKTPNRARPARASEPGSGTPGGGGAQVPPLPPLPPV